MAIINPNNSKYYKIETFNLSGNIAYFKIFENKAHRTKGESEFNQAVWQEIHIPTLATALNETANGNKSIKNNIISACYTEAKKLPEFTNYQDD